MSIEVKCNACGNDIEIDTYCVSCYSELEAENKKLTNQVEELMSDIERLEDEIEHKNGEEK